MKSLLNKQLTKILVYCGETQLHANIKGKWTLLLCFLVTNFQLDISINQLFHTAID